jgi:hypothetical protein
MSHRSSHQKYVVVARENSLYSRHDITEILLKVALNTIKQTNIFSHFVVELLSEDFKTFAKTENSYVQTMTINDGSHLEF